MTSGSSMQAMIRIAPPQAGQVSDVDPEHPLEALRPGHRGTAFGRRRLLRIRGPGVLTAPAPLGRRHARPVLAVWRKDAVETAQVDPWFRHQAARRAMKSRVRR